ncbi:UNVERIFIED_CONTAM: hypothetical protein FKN15_076427 [Acipenser sinensis]
MLLLRVRVTQSAAGQNDSYPFYPYALSFSDELFQKVAEDYHNSTSFQLMTEEKGVDLGQKRDSYFYSCCH